MQGNVRRRSQAVPIQNIIMSIVMLIGIITIWVAIARSNHTLLYVGLCVTGVGVGLGLVQLLLRNKTAAESRKTHGLSDVMRQ